MCIYYNDFYYYYYCDVVLGSVTDEILVRFMVIVIDV